MSDITADQLAQRIHACRLMETKLLESLLADARAPGEDQASHESFSDLLLRHEHLTNWQLQRVEEGHRVGYFYGNWRILYLIGAGTFARVYRAVHSKTGDVKAVKVLRSRYSADEDMQEQFLREARVVMKLRHPNIVPIHEVETERNRLYMVMDFVEGQNLRDYVRAHSKLSAVRCVKIITDLAAGLQYAAELGIGHRDMKLSNVLLSSKGQAKLVDFGLATLDGETDGNSGGPRSIDYAGLERCTGVRREDTRSDIYFLGCMLYHMACGVPALLETRERMKRLSVSRYTDVKPITVHDPNLPHRLVVLIGRMMELDPEKRLQTPADVLREANLVHESLLAGDTASYDAKLSDQQAAEYAQQVAVVDEGHGKTLLIIESNIKLQNLLREKLKELGYRVLITSDPERGLERFDGLEAHEEPPVDCVIFGTAGLGRTGVKAFRKHTTAEATKRLASVLIVSEQLKSIVKKDWFGEKIFLFAMPIKFKSLQKALRKALGIQVSEPS